MCNLNFMEYRDEASVAYNVFYEAARKFSDVDQLNDIAFTVALNPDGNEFGEVSDVAVIHLFLWNETVAYVRHCSLSFKKVPHNLFLLMCTTFFLIRQHRWNHGLQTQLRNG